MKDPLASSCPALTPARYARATRALPDQPGNSPSQQAREAKWPNSISSRSATVVASKMKRVSALASRSTVGPARGTLAREASETTEKPCEVVLDAAGVVVPGQAAPHGGPG